MTDPTPQTTPTRDEAVRAANGDNRPFPNYKVMPDPTDEMLASPQFEAIWNVIKSWDVNVPEAYSGYCGANGSHVAMILKALASAPAPASGGVDAVREALLGYVLKPGQYETASAFARGQNRVAVDMLGVLDEASLSPAATPVSEAGGEVDWLVEHLLSWPCTGDERDGKSEAYINGLMRQAARRIEALAKPASSPAGGDVVRAALEAIIADWDERSVGEQERFVQMHEDRPGYWSPNARMVSSEKIAAGRIALSQSTSAGRVGE